MAININSIVDSVQEQINLVTVDTDTIEILKLLKAASETGDEFINIASITGIVGLQDALDLKADLTDLSSHTSNTSNPHSVTKSQVGLGNVDNTSDLNKPISTATQTALDLKANQSTTYTKTEVDTAISAATPTFATILEKPTTVSGYGITDAYTKTETDTNISGAISNLVNSAPAALDTLNELATALGNDASFASTVTTSLSNKVDKTTTVNGHALSGNVIVSKSDVGLGSVDNTSDLNKPISTATQSALDGKAGTATTLAGYGITDAYTKTQIDTFKNNYALLSGATFTGAVTHSSGSTLNGGITADTSVVNIGSGQIYKDTSGNVGIGTSSPSVGLNVKGNGVKGGIVSQGDSEGWLTIAGNFSDPLIAWKSTGALRFGTETDTYTTGWTERMRIDSSGNVGIGVTPDGTAKLEVAQTNSNVKLSVGYSYTGSSLKAKGLQPAPIRFVDTDDNEQWVTGMAGNSGAGYYGIWYARNSTTDFDISTTSPLLTLNANGNLSTALGNTNAMIGFNAVGDYFTPSGGSSTPHYGIARGSNGNNTLGISGYSGLAFYTSGTRQMTLDTVGNMTLAGNITSAGNTVLTSANVGSYASTFTVGQTWQSVSGSRALNTTYTNSTGKPIFIAPCFYRSGADGNFYIQLTVNGSACMVQTASTGYAANTNQYATLSAIIPNGATYSVATGGSTGVTMAYWYELR